MSSAATNLFSNISSGWHSIPAWVRVTSLFAISISGVLAASFIDGYRKWKAMGPGGLPYSWKGYVMNIIATATLASSDTMTLAVYNKPEKYSATWKEATEAEKGAAFVRFLKTDLSKRLGPQARAKVFVIPQRQSNEDEAVDEELKETYLAAFDKLQEENEASTEWRTSVLERRGKAIFLKPSISVPTLAAQTQGEVCHIHGSDLSGHVTLSYADAREVIAKGWGERHRLSGSRLIPLGYTMLFVPRSADEIEVLLSIYQAGIDYMQNGK